MQLSESKAIAPCSHCQQPKHPPENAGTFQMSPKTQNLKEMPQNTFHRKGKTKEIRFKQYPRIRSKILYTRNTTTPVRQYSVSDPTTVAYHSHESLNTGISSNVFQRKNEQHFFQRDENMHLTHKTFPTFEYYFTRDFQNQFRPLPEVVAYDKYFLDPRNGRDPIALKIHTINTDWSKKTTTKTQRPN